MSAERQEDSQAVSDSTMGPPSRTTTTRDEHSEEEGMGPRASTISEGVAVVSSSSSSRHDNYSLYLGAPSSSSSADEKPDRYRLSTLKKALTPEKEHMFLMPFDAWRVADRSQIPGWKCSVRSPVSLGDLKPFGTQDILAKVSVFRGGVMSLALDAIANAANEECLGGGGVDGAIHDAAGSLLHRECSTFNGCMTGQTRLTKGYYLPARFVLHTVGPIGERPRELASCYRSCLALARHHSLRSVGFCCISTGIFGYPLAAATRVALTTCLTVLNEYSEDFDMVAFACFKAEEEDCYLKLLPDVYREVLSRKQPQA